jgi:trk system potassium uptake protein TrkH
LCLSGSIPNYIDAFFETCSGYSTTGATILRILNHCQNQCLLAFFYPLDRRNGCAGPGRGFASRPGIGGQFIAKAESPAPTLSKLTPKISDTARLFYILYLVLTIIEIILLLMGGVNIYDACIHTFGTVGTGGFSSYNAGIAAFDSLYVEIILTIFMFVSGASYYLYFLALQNGVRNFLRDSEFKLYFLIFAVSSVLIAAGLLLDGNYATFGEALRYSSFQSISILTTTGFATADYIFWPTFCQIMLLLLFFIGGCSSSTAGGIKVIRVFVMMKLIKRTIGMKLHPSAVVTVKVNGNKTLPGDTVSGIASFVFLYICLILREAYCCPLKISIC